MSFHHEHRRSPSLTRDGYLIAGQTNDRPRGLGIVETGVNFFDQTIGKPIWWDGEKWVLVDGTPADPAAASTGSDSTVTNATQATPTPTPTPPQPDTGPTATVSA